MAHELYTEDTALFAEEAAWHGIGLVLDHAPGPDEALELSGLNWEVGKDPIWRARDGSLIKSHVETYRKPSPNFPKFPNGLPLGVVGDGYEIVQNRELFELAYEISGQRPDLKVESAFSMKRCTRVIVTVRADTFMAQKGDDVKMYLVLANGHDGTLVLSGYYSATRVVCNNTFKASLAAAIKGEGIMTIRHKGDMEEKMKEITKFLGNYAKTFAAYQDKVAAMVDRKLSKDEMDSFLLGAVMAREGAIPTEADTLGDSKDAKKAAKQRTKCYEAYNDICARFDKEAQELRSGRNLWMAFNAFTGWLQHDREGRQSKNEQQRLDNKVFSEQFGTTATAQEKVWADAMALV